MGKDKKQFPLDSKDNCCIYLCRIISSCELCMDKLKKYNKQTELELGKHSSKDLISKVFERFEKCFCFVKTQKCVNFMG